MKVEYSCFKVIAVPVLLLSVTIYVLIYVSLQCVVLPRDNTNITNTYRNSMKARIQSCKLVDSKLMQRKSHFRWENRNFNFINMASLLQRPRCVFCAEVCEMIGHHTTSKNEILKKLGDMVQRRIDQLQSPKNCSSVKRLACAVNRGENGIGSQVHIATHCLLMAHASNRTLVLDTTLRRYSQYQWDDMLLPVSTCTLDGNGKYVSKYDLEGILNSPHNIIKIFPNFHHAFGKPDYLSLAVPESLAFALNFLTDDPPAWWIGQYVNYIYRLRPHVESKLQSELQTHFKGLIAGVHIRRGDKVTDHANMYRPIYQYMDHVTEFFRGRKSKQVFVATDSLSVLEDLETNYSAAFNFTCLHKNTEAGRDLVGTDTLYEAVRDLYMLSNCDFIVCTLSSNWCRLLYELSLARGRNVTHMFRSLDGAYHLGYLRGNKEIYVVEKTHDFQMKGMQMSVGDVIERMNKEDDHEFYSGGNYNNGSKGNFSIQCVRRVYPVTNVSIFNF